ncbi:MAG: (d)CMP kinase [Wenzhouxiangellaceae bacterium]
MSASAPVLAIDGPSGAGKGAVSAQLARRLGWHLLDSGAVYRALALRSLQAGIDGRDEAALVDLARNLALEFKPGVDGIEVCLAGAPVGSELRSEAVSLRASEVAAIPAVRAALLDEQRSRRQPPGLVADGRDMGTIVFPDAGLKIFLDADLRERARRRFKQLKQKGKHVTFDRLYQDMLERDRRDRERAVAPTVPAPDAIVVDSTEMSLSEVVDRIEKLARERFGDAVVSSTDRTR